MSPIHEDVSQRIKESLRDVLELMRRFEETGMDQVMEDDYRSLYDLYERLEEQQVRLEEALDGGDR